MRKLTCPVRKVNAQVIGFDLHKRLIVYCLLDRKGRELGTGRFAATAEAVEAFLAEHVGRKRTHFAFEASGCSQWIFDLLSARYPAERIHVGHARRISAIANSRQKTDEHDAFWLAYLTHEGRLPESFIPAGSLRELRIATRRRVDLVRQRTRAVVVLKAEAAQLGYDLRGAGLRSERAQEKAWELARATQGSRGQLLYECLEEIDRLDLAIAAWEQRVAELVAELPAVEQLRRRIPGLGAVLAATVYAESGPIDRFASAKTFAAFTGLAPSCRISAGRAAPSTISREGNPYLRWALTQAVMACTRARHGAARAVGEWVRARERRMGCKGKARCAAARKLAETIWRLFDDPEHFDAARPFGGLRAAA